MFFMTAFKVQVVVVNTVSKLPLVAECPVKGVQIMGHLFHRCRHQSMRATLIVKPHLYLAITYQASSKSNRQTVVPYTHAAQTAPWIVAAEGKSASMVQAKVERRLVA
jgi:hypothetical protein